MRQNLALAAFLLLCQTAIRAQEEQKQLNSVDTVSCPPPSVVQKSYNCALDSIFTSATKTQLAVPQLLFRITDDFHTSRRGRRTARGKNISSAPGLKRKYLSDIFAAKGHSTAALSFLGHRTTKIQATEFWVAHRLRTLLAQTSSLL